MIPLTKEYVSSFHKNFVLQNDCSEQLYPSFEHLDKQLCVKDGLFANIAYPNRDQYVCPVVYPHSQHIRDPFIDNQSFISSFTTVQDSAKAIDYTLQQHLINYYRQSAILSANLVAAKDPILSFTCYKTLQPIKIGDELLACKGFVYGLKKVAKNGLLTPSNVKGFISFINNNYDILSTNSFVDKTFIDEIRRMNVNFSTFYKDL